MLLQLVPLLFCFVGVTSLAQNISISSVFSSSFCISPFKKVIKSKLNFNTIMCSHEFFDLRRLWVYGFSSRSHLRLTSDFCVFFSTVTVTFSRSLTVKHSLWTNYFCTDGFSPMFYLRLNYLYGVKHERAAWLWLTCVTQMLMTSLPNSAGGPCNTAPDPNVLLKCLEKVKQYWQPSISPAQGLVLSLFTCSLQWSVCVFMSKKQGIII